MRAANPQHTNPGTSPSRSQRLPHDALSIDHLSGRERQVFERFARGDGRREIASDLAIEVKTVDTYLHRIKGKLKVSSLRRLRCLAAVSRFHALEGAR